MADADAGAGDRRERIDAIQSPALFALDHLLGDQSELHALWQENKKLYPKWRAGIVALITRLEKFGVRTRPAPSGAPKLIALKHDNDHAKHVAHPKGHIMDTHAFWKLIDSTRKKSSNDPDAHIEALTEALAKLSVQEIVDFDRIFTQFTDAAYTWDLWLAAFIIDGGCSDDGFMDFRDWLISQGPKVYADAVANPDSLSRVLDDDPFCQVEGFGYVGQKAWAEKTGRDYGDFSGSYGKRPKKPLGKKWKEADMKKRCPKLFKKYWDD